MTALNLTHLRSHHQIANPAFEPFKFLSLTTGSHCDWRFPPLILQLPNAPSPGSPSLQTMNLPHSPPNTPSPQPPSLQIMDLPPPPPPSLQIIDSPPSPPPTTNSPSPPPTNPPPPTPPPTSLPPTNPPPPSPPSPPRSPSPPTLPPPTTLAADLATIIPAKITFACATCARSHFPEIGDQPLLIRLSMLVAHPAARRSEIEVFTAVHARMTRRLAREGNADRLVAVAEILAAAPLVERMMEVLRVETRRRGPEGTGMDAVDGDGARVGISKRRKVEDEHPRGRAGWFGKAA